MAKRTNGFRDPAFTKNREAPLHRWVPWVAGFSAQFVQDCLNKYLPGTAPNSQWVLDPFAGVGTTLVEGYLRGLNVLGFEINPYAALAAQSKVGANEVSASLLSRKIRAFESYMARMCENHATCGKNPKSQAPNGFSGRIRLFNPKVERKVLYALDFISNLEDRRMRDLFRLSLGSVMVSVSNYSYEPSLTRRSAVGKPPIEDAPVGEVVATKLKLMLEDIEWLQDEMRAMPRAPRARVIPESIFSAPERLKAKEFVDLVVTSPPYLNNYHYPRNTRPQLHWLGLASGTGYHGARENESFGKFWQTVRSCAPIKLSFIFPGLEEVIATIRGLNKEEGAYGGPGWANYLATYFNDTHRFCQALTQLLRPGGVAAIVLGNSIIQGVEVRTDQYFGQIAALCGLSFEDSILLRKKRTGSSIIRSSVRVDKASLKTDLYESAIILRK